MEKLSKDICFLAKDNIYSNTTNGYKELILSPYYYWVFEKKLPVKDTKRAKKILPQMLQSSLPKSEFEYVVIQNKEDKNSYEIFVIDLTVLKTKLSSFSIPFDNVSSISFSHKEFQNIQLQLQNSVLVSDEKYSYEVNISKNVSSALQKEDMLETLKKKNKLNYKYSLGNGTLLQKSVDFLDNSFLSIFLILTLLLSTVGVNFYSNTEKINKYETKRQELLASQKFATHQVQLKYIMDNILELDSTQKKFRNKLRKLLSVKTNTNTFIDSVEYDDGSWYIKIQSTSKKEADKIISKSKHSFIKKDKNYFIYESNQ